MCHLPEQLVPQEVQPMIMVHLDSGSLVLSNSPFDFMLVPSPRAAEAEDSYGIPVVDAFKDDILGLYMYVIIYSEINGILINWYHWEHLM